jgi:uncharacterized protein (TIGR03089 family)
LTNATPPQRAQVRGRHADSVTTPTDLLLQELRSDGSRPLLTFYDDATGERVELSVATTANWVAKTTSFLADEHGVDVDDVVTVLLPLHWQTVVVLLAAWAAGAQVSFDTGGLVTFCAAGTKASVDGAELVELSFAAMGADFSRLVASQPDSYVPLRPGGGDLVDAAPVDLPHGSRVLSVLSYATAESLSYGLIAPLAVSGSLVLVAHPDADKLAGHAQTERVTHTLGVSVAGLPRLDASASTAEPS